MEREVDKLKELIATHDGNVHVNKLEKVGLKPSFSYKYPPESIVQCVFCNAPWSPEMLQLFEESGYCESCFNSSPQVFIACSSCGRIVYAK